MEGMIKVALSYTIFTHHIAGELYLLANEKELLSISIGEEDFWKRNKTGNAMRRDDDPILQTAMQLLINYFNGERVDYTIPAEAHGTSFQRDVWQAIALIPWGETRSYSDIASAIHRPRAVRAVGQASRANPYPFLIPCHRVVGKNGALTGYAGSRVHIKEYLLHYERSILKEKAEKGQ
jgi:methylated-DNA-[protein]-cysteine S-methyltransferase